MMRMMGTIGRARTMGTTYRMGITGMRGRMEMVRCEVDRDVQRFVVEWFTLRWTDSILARTFASE
jgi:hypothetical protein